MTPYVIQWAAGLVALGVAAIMSPLVRDAFRGSAGPVQLAQVPGWLLIVLTSFYILRRVIFADAMETMTGPELQSLIALRALSIITCLFALATYNMLRGK